MKSDLLKKSGIGLALVVSGLFCQAAYGQAAAPLKAKERVVTINGKSYTLKSKLKSLLITNFWYNYNHTTDGGIPNMLKVIKKVGAEEGWKVDQIDDGGQINAAKLANYQVFFANYITSWGTSNTPSAAFKEGIEDFVTNKGGGVYLMHGSADSRVGNSKWPWYFSTMHPTQYNGENYPRVAANVSIPAKAQTHPIMEGLPVGPVKWEDGEWYKYQKLITTVQPKAEVLYTMDAASCTQCAKGATGFIGYDQPGGYPVAWVFPVGKGTIGYFMEGHGLGTMNSMTAPVWEKFFKQAMYYMAGYDTTLVDGTTGIKKEFALNDNGITFHPDNEMGVLINKAGAHTVSIFNMAGARIKQYSGHTFPVDYSFTQDLRRSGRGKYLVKVDIAGQVVSKTFNIK